MNFFTTLDAGVQKVLRFLTIVLFILLTCILFSNVCLRLVNDFSVFCSSHGFPGVAAAVKSLFPASSLHWLDEIIELCVAALVFYGAAGLWGVNGHFSVGDWISSRLPNRFSRALYKLIVTGISLFFLVVFFWFSLQLTLRATELSTVFQIPKSWMYACMPISSLIMLTYSLAEFVRNIKAFAGENGQQ